MVHESATRTKEHRRFHAGSWSTWPRRLQWRAGELAAALRNTFEAELAERAGLHWLAVLFGLGALAYFLLPREPLFPALASGTAIFSAAAAFAYRRGATWRVLTVLAVVLAGASAAKLRVEGDARDLCGHAARLAAAEACEQVAQGSELAGS